MTPERSEQLRRTAIDSKDAILTQISEIDSLDEFFIRAAAIGTAINLTQGLWVELNYAYKAQEILEALMRKLNELEESNPIGIMDLTRIILCRSLLTTQIDDFYHLQQERMSKDASLN